MSVNDKAKDILLIYFWINLVYIISFKFEALQAAWLMCVGHTNSNIWISQYYMHLLNSFFLKKCKSPTKKMT